jgi:hypothetical protein
MARNLFPMMVQVSRDCGYTRHLHTIFNSELSEHGLQILQEWLKVVNEERQMEKNRAKRKNMFGGL